MASFMEPKSPIDLLRHRAEVERSRAAQWAADAQQDRDAASEKDGYAADSLRLATEFEAAAVALEVAAEAHPNG